MKRRTFLALGGAGLGAQIGPAAQPQTPGVVPRFSAGAGRADITPAPGTPHGTWGAQTHERGIGSDMPEFATALVVSYGAMRVAIVDVDAIALSLELAARILDATAKLTGIPRDHIRVSYSHTHSGVNLSRLGVIAEGLDMAMNYIEGLPARVAGAVWQAQNNLQPARVAAATGSCPIAVNRRLKLPDGKVIVGKNWDGPADQTMRVVRIDGLDEQPIATLVHYACHPIIVGWQNQYFTPDYPGVLRQVVERNIGGTCLFLQGAAGNIMPRKAFTGDLRVYRRLGTLLGLEAGKVALGIETLPRRERYIGFQPSGAPNALYAEDPVEPAPPALRVISRAIELPLRKLERPEPAEAEAEQSHRALAALRAQHAPAEQIREAMIKTTQALMRAQKLRALHGRTHIPAQLQGIRIGDIALIGLPVEPFIEIGQAVVTASPFQHTLFSGYSNGSLGYLPVRAAFADGGYEVETSGFTPDTADVVVKESIRMLKELKG